MPHLGSGITWKWKDPAGRERTVMASPNLNAGLVTVIDLDTYETVKQIKTLGPGFFLRSHENSRYAFTDSMMSKENKERAAGDRQAEPRSRGADQGRTRTDAGARRVHPRWPLRSGQPVGDGWRAAGDRRQTLREVKRIPARKPVGKYNVWNKISRSEGTSH
jgi:hypothetical protein